MPKSMTSTISIAQLTAAIEKLPSDPWEENTGVWYHTQKEHWLGWLEGYLGPGGYNRKVIKDDARYCYNHVVNSQLLEYLAWACGKKVGRDLEVKSGFRKGRTSRA
jgi:hypothetical protein